jgi:serine/threonine protein kinase
MINIDCNREVLNEFNILKKLHHPLIIDIQEVLEEPKKFYIIEEICMGGDVAHALTSKPAFSEEEAAHIIKAALLTLSHIHSKGIVHRNIKPGNFVFKKTGVKLPKLIDFGSAVDLSSKHLKEKLPLQRIVGQPAYMSPEMLKECYNEKTDIWSLGIMLFELLSNKLPFDASTD